MIKMRNIQTGDGDGHSSSVQDFSIAETRGGLLLSPANEQEVQETEIQLQHVLQDQNGGQDEQDKGIDLTDASGGLTVREVECQLILQDQIGRQDERDEGISVIDASGGLTVREDVEVSPNDPEYHCNTSDLAWPEELCLDLYVVHPARSNLYLKFKDFFNVLGIQKHLAKENNKMLIPFFRNQDIEDPFYLSKSSGKFVRIEGLIAAALSFRAAPQERV